MTSALIGHTGFVGGTLLRQRPFDDLFNTTNVESISGREYDLLVCSAMPAAKWIANREPERDAASLDRLVAALDGVNAARVVVISTVDVYAVPKGVDESSVVDAALLHPYGRHRLALERAVRDRFPATTVLRLPGLFGAGLKKNALFDLVHDNEVEKIDPNAVFQFYNLERLAIDMDRAIALGVPVVNLVTEPVAIGTVADRIFGRVLYPRSGEPPAYNVETRYARAFGGIGAYLQSAEHVLGELAEFVARERRRP